MTTYRYWIFPDKILDGEKHEFYEDGDFVEHSVFQLGRDGWEFAYHNVREGTVLFKKTVDDREEQDNLISAELMALANELEQIKTRETVLVSLLQALVKKFAPDAEALAMLEGIEKEPQQTAAPAAGEEADEKAASQEEAEQLDEMTLQFADERMEVVQRNQGEDRAMSLFVALVGMGGLLPLQTKESHYRYMLEALYRSYRSTEDKSLEETYMQTLNMIAGYLASPGAIESLNQIAKASMTIEDGADTFFGILITELEQEKRGNSPFVLQTAGELIGTHQTQLARSPELQENGELMEKVSRYLDRIRQEYGVDCG